MQICVYVNFEDYFTLLVFTLFKWTHFLTDIRHFRLNIVIRGLLKENEAKTSEDTAEEISTTSSENVAFPSEPDLAVDCMH